MDFKIMQEILQTDLHTLRNQLAQIVKEKSITTAPPGEPFVLTSGLTSAYYINGKLTTGDPHGSYCLARLILEKVKFHGAQAVGGPTLGADPIVGAVSTLSYILGHPTSLFMVRKEAKKHGARQQIEGPGIRGKRIIFVEDVITTAGSALRAIEAVQAMECEIMCVTALVDREQGGKEAFAAIGIPYEPIFTISELLPKEILSTTPSP